MQFRYEGLDGFLKGNTHMHTTNSDGEWTVDQTLDRYAAAGYDWLAITDHNTVTRASSDDLCLIPSTEINDRPDGWRTHHVVCIGVGEDFPEKSDFDTMLAAAKADGAVTYLAHPSWSANTVEQALAADLDGVELFNGVTFYHNHKESGVWMWDELLGRGLDKFGFAADDNHGRPNDLPTHDMGWTMVAATENTPDAILSALRAGRFYASTGPEFHSFRLEDDKLHFHCTPVQHAWLLGPGWFNRRINCRPGEFVTEHTFDLSFLADATEMLPFLRLEIRDEQGRRAWTNKLFI